MGSILGIVEPLPFFGTRGNIAVQVLYVDLVGWIDGLTGRAIFIKAYLKLAVALNHAIWGRVIYAIVAETQTVAILCSKSVAFA